MSAYRARAAARRVGMCSLGGSAARYCLRMCLAAVSSLGFVAAFLWGEVGRYLCWLGVGLPVVVIAWMAAAHVLARRNS